MRIVHPRVRKRRLVFACLSLAPGDWIGVVLTGLSRSNQADSQTSGQATEFRADSLA